jgi:tight adherence protein B
MLAASAISNVLLILLPLAGSILLAYGVFNVAVDLKRNDRQRVKDRLRGDSPRRRRERDEGMSFEDFRRHTAEAKGILARWMSNLSFTASFQRVLEQANIPWSAAQTLVNLSAIASVLLAALLILRFSPIAAGGVAVAVFVLPILYFYRRRKKRLDRLIIQLPDVFELLSQALRAGHSLASAMQLVSKEVPDPAGTEFARVFHEQNLGLKIEDSLRNLAERVDVLDVRLFVTAVLIQRQVGGDLAEVLDKIGRLIRGRLELYGTVKVLTAEGRLSGYVLLALPVLVLLAIMYLNYPYAEVLFTDPTGKMLLTAAVVMQLMGWAMIKKIVNIKV